MAASCSFPTRSVQGLVCYSCFALIEQSSAGAAVPDSGLDACTGQRAPAHDQEPAAHDGRRSRRLVPGLFSCCRAVSLTDTLRVQTNSSLYPILLASIRGSSLAVVEAASKLFVQVCLCCVRELPAGLGLPHDVCPMQMQLARHKQGLSTFFSSSSLNILTG